MEIKKSISQPKVGLANSQTRGSRSSIGSHDEFTGSAVISMEQPIYIKWRQRNRQSRLLKYNRRRRRRSFSARLHQLKKSKRLKATKKKIWKRISSSLSLEG